MVNRNCAVIGCKNSRYKSRHGRRKNAVSIKAYYIRIVLVLPHLAFTSSQV